MGTTMGTSWASSVVDRDCRFHGYDNFFVAGSSLLPSGGYANPTLTIVALALRLADHLRGSLQAPAARCAAGPAPPRAHRERASSG